MLSRVGFSTVGRSDLNSSSSNCIQIYNDKLIHVSGISIFKHVCLFTGSERVRDSDFKYNSNYICIHVY